MKKLIAGNWKMNGNLEGAVSLASAVVAGVRSNPDLLKTCDFLICPPFVHLTAVKTVLDPAVALGGQDCSQWGDGAFTGDISCDMLLDMGCRYVIVGHSERRQIHKEDNIDVYNKAVRGAEKKLTPIICVGETADQRENSTHYDVVGQQIVESISDLPKTHEIVVAYEPVWAIGTGKTATPEDVKAMHGFIREKLKEVVEKAQNIRILYGGSVKPGNAAELLATENVDGALIGGASLKADDFLAIAQAV